MSEKMTKKQLKDELLKLGLEEGKDYPKGIETSVEDLEKLLAKTLKKQDKIEDVAGKTETEDEVVESNVPADGEDKPEPILGPQLKKNSKSYSGEGNIDIVRGNRYIRTFSLENHGEDFKDLATAFINKNTDPVTKKTPFVMVDSDSVKKLKVEFTRIDKKGTIEKVSNTYGADLVSKERALQLANENSVGVYIA